jgi:hypothetical protein
MIKAFLDTEIISGRTKTLIATTIVLLSFCDARMSHRITNGDQVLTIVEHCGGKCTVDIMIRALLYTCLSLAFTKNMIIAWSGCNYAIQMSHVLLDI